MMGSVVGGLVLGGTRFFGARGQPLLVGWEGALASEIGSGLAGRVVDILSGQPIPGAPVSAVESASGSVVAATSTSDSGEFALAVPPGTYEVKVSAPRFVGMSRVRQQVDGSSVTRVDFRMIPLDVRPEDEQRLYDAVVTAPESALDVLAVLHGEPLLTTPPPAETVLNTTLSNRVFFPYVANSTGSNVKVPETIVVKFQDGRTEPMPLDEYLKGVVPKEMPSSWAMEALKAQAVAARSYAVAYYLARGYICTTPACQVYSDERDPRTSEAVDATHNQVAVYNGTIISANFFAKCDGTTTLNSEDALASYDNWKTCQSAPWAYSPYLRKKPCGGHSRYTSSCGYQGHGVGMCQWGAKARADSGWSYRDIITYYYTSVTVEVGTSAG